MARVAVLGAGAWGTAIASVLAARLEVALWARDPAQAEAIAATRRNERYLPGIEIAKSIDVASDLDRAMARSQLALVATPVAGLRDTLRRLGKQTPFVWLCKGFEEGSGLLPHQIVEEVLGGGARCGALSGPSFAAEVARGLPCALTLASRDPDFARDSAALLHGGRMRVYYSADLVGVEIGGAVKNVMAIAAGISDGLGHVAEGVSSAKEVARIAAARGVDMPVTDAVNAVLEGKLAPAKAVELLLSRDPKKER